MCRTCRSIIFGKIDRRWNRFLIKCTRTYSMDFQTQFSHPLKTYSTNSSAERLISFSIVPYLLINSSLYFGKTDVFEKGASRRKKNFHISYFLSHVESLFFLVYHLLRIIMYNPECVDSSGRWKIDLKANAFTGSATRNLENDRSAKLQRTLKPIRKLGLKGN